MKKSRLNTGSRFNLLSCLLATILGLLLSVSMAHQAEVVLSLDDYSHYRCTTVSAAKAETGGAVFRILTLTTSGAVELADSLCGDEYFARLFSAVDITWQDRGFLQTHHIVEERYDYFWNRLHLVEGLVPEWQRFYMPLMNTPSYTLYWLSRFQPFELSSEANRHKRFAFIQDHFSQSYYLQPFRILKEAGMQLDESQKFFYLDYESMLEAFRQGEVDVMPSYYPAPDALNGIDFHSSILAENVVSGTWFLRQQWQESGLHCRLIAHHRHDILFDSPMQLLEAQDDCIELL